MNKCHVLFLSCMLPLFIEGSKLATHMLSLSLSSLVESYSKSRTVCLILAKSIPDIWYLKHMLRNILYLETFLVAFVPSFSVSMLKLFSLTLMIYRIKLRFSCEYVETHNQLYYVDSSVFF